MTDLPKMTPDPQGEHSATRSCQRSPNPDFDLASTPMLAKANDGSSDPGSKSIRGSEKRDVEDWSFESFLRAVLPQVSLIVVRGLPAFWRSPRPTP